MSSRPEERYAGRGVELAEVAGGLQFRTAPDLAPRLTRVIEVPRRLPRVAMETLAIIAYRQPVTRGEIEEVRGTALSQNTLDALLEAELIAPRGRKESPGRPTLWGTTPNFLAKFGLNSLSDLPRRDDLDQRCCHSRRLPPTSRPMGRFKWRRAMLRRRGRAMISPWARRKGRPQGRPRRPITSRTVEV